MEERAWTKVVDDWFRIVKQMHEAGVSLLPGSDNSYPHEVLRHEMKLYVERAGISPADVLNLVTLGAARAAGQDHDLGSIEVGKLADIVLVDGNPAQNIDDIRKVAVVIKDGTIYDPAAILEQMDISP